MEKKASKKIRPAQSQRRPGKQSKLEPESITTPIQYNQGKLQNKVALITGGDSGIGKAICLLFAKEGAKIALSYLSETDDAETTATEIQELGGEVLLLKGDLGKEAHCKSVISRVIKKFGELHIVINNAALHWQSESITDITTEQLTKTFHANFYSCFWITKYALPHLKEGASIINTSSVTAYRGSPHLIDYSATKGAMIAFTRSLSANLVEKGIRVNAVAPGPIWTPLIASSLPKTKVATFGSSSPMKRHGEPFEVATCFLFLASADASYITGQVLHPNGGEIVNG